MSRLLFVVALALFASGCDESLSDVAGPTPNLEPTLSSIQREIFNAADSSGRVACTNCHNTQGARFAGNLNLTEGISYSQLVNIASSAKSGAIRVIPGNANDSYLIHKLEGTAGIIGERMPRTSGPFLTPGQVQIIRAWIDQGALNN
jgi:hypothetical protein